jgi:type I restriction enzyme S subunit
MLKETEIGIIPQDWDVVCIEDVASHQKYALSMGPFGSNITKDNFVPQGVPVIRGNNLTTYRFLDSDFAFVSDEKADELVSSNVKPNDIVITHRGTLGQVGIIPEKSKYPRYVVSQSGMKLTCDREQVDPNFVFYWLKSPKGQQELLKNTSQTGVPAIAQPLSSLRKILLPKPSIREQHAIAKILYDLDSKIELNQQMNKTIEAIGKITFKQWFVNFEFPNEEGRPYKSSGGQTVYDEELEEKIPTGWEVRAINDIVTVRGGSTPSTENVEYWDGGQISWCTPKDLSRLDSPILLDTERKITEKGVATISSGLLPVGTVLLSSRAPIGYLAISEIPVAINQGFIAIVCDKAISKYFMLFWLQQNMDTIESRAHGTTFQEINKANFRSIRILVPAEDVLRKFDELVHPLFRTAVENEKGRVILSQMRDLLLPRLMSGKIRVPVEVN